MLARVLTQDGSKTLCRGPAESDQKAPGNPATVLPRDPRNVSANPGTWEIFTLMRWRDKRLTHGWMGLTLQYLGAG